MNLSIPPGAPRPVDLAERAAWSGSRAPQPARLEPRIGDRLGPYYLQELVGEGGMGRVFRAVHEKLGRQVAIKLLRRTASYGNGVERFLREARVVNRLRHPGLIEITDIVEAPPGGDSYYVMEWLEGKNLHERMLEHGGRVPQPEVLRILTEVCATLHAVHEAGLVHRDLKPENIFLVTPRPGEPERVKVIDFGVALDLRDPGSLRDDDIVGTPAYVAPEQARGEHTDGRSDQYALGVILYELTVGRLPFEARTALGSLAQRLQGGFVRPRKAAPKGVRIPRQLERVILRCMAPEPARRYPDMAALGQDLAALRRYLERPRWQRGPGGLLAVGGPVVVAGVAAGALWAEREAVQRRVQRLWGEVHARLVPEPTLPLPKQPLEFEVQVQTIPPGAEVRHRGELLGVTPCVVRLPEGRQEVELRRTGYRRARRSIDVHVGAQLSVRLLR